MQRECCCVQEPDGRWVSLEPVRLFILDKDKYIIIYDHNHINIRETVLYNSMMYVLRIMIIPLFLVLLSYEKWLYYNA